MFRSTRSDHSTKGFTLIELLLYVGISSVILFVVSLFLAQLLQSRIKNQIITEVEQQGIQVMQNITSTTRNAISIAYPSQGVSQTTLGLVMPSPNNPTLYDFIGGAIRITEGAGAPIALTNSRVIISNPTFTNLSRSNTPGTIRVQFTLTHVNPSGRNEYNYSKTFIGTATLRKN